MIIYMIMSISAGLLIAIFPWIPWRSIAVWWVGDNPDRAIVYVKAGSRVKKYIAKRGLELTKGQTYNFTRGKKQVMIVVHSDYPYDYIEGYRMIGAKDGFEDAVPIFGEGGVFGIDDMEAYADSRNYVGFHASIQKGSDISKLLIFIVVAAIAGAGVMYLFQKYVSKGG